MKCSRFEAVIVKLEITYSVLSRNLTVNMTTKVDLGRGININNGCAVYIEDDVSTDIEPNLYL